MCVGVHQHACICVSPARASVGVVFCIAGCVRVCVSVCPPLINDSVFKISIKPAFISNLLLAPAIYRSAIYRSSPASRSPEEGPGAGQMSRGACKARLP